MVYLALSVIIILVGIDQIIKLWAFNNLAEALVPINFIKFGDTRVIDLCYHKNTGAAFSILEGKTTFLIILTSIFLLVGLYLIISKRIKPPFLLISVALIIAGGIGNLIDRIFRGFVIDYIEIKLFNFAVFNFADICVVVGTILFLVFIIFLDKPKKDVPNGSL